MQTIRVPATERSPEVEFDLERRRLRLTGESYPEDAAAFFGPLQQALRDLAASPDRRPLCMEVALVYFNSSSAKALMNMFMALEQAAAAGTPVTVRWHFHPEDEAMQEFGEDFAADFRHADFQLCATAETDSGR